MSTYKHESHYRSILKGVSWRIIATTDTVLIVLLITCLHGDCSIEDGFKIGVLEFFIKLAIYYVHERIWTNAISGKTITKKITVYKSIIWRIIATATTFLIAGQVLKGGFGDLSILMAIALTEVFTKFILYYLHERLWLKLPLGRIRNYILKNK